MVSNDLSLGHKILRSIHTSLAQPGLSTCVCILKISSKLGCNYREQRAMLQRPLDTCSISPKTPARSILRSDNQSETQLPHTFQATLNGLSIEFADVIHQIQIAYKCLRKERRVYNAKFELLQARPVFYVLV